jgi:mycofactocin system glycosyltransferase
VSIGLPADFRLELDPGAWLTRADVLMGGTPFRIVRLSEPQAAELAGWLAGGPVGDRPAAGLFARALVSAGLARPVPPAPGAEYSVSVVIPVRDRAKQLDRLLAAVRRVEDTDPFAEVVVVDDASAAPDELAAVVAAHGARYVRRPVRGGPAAARNEGARMSTGDVLAFIDSDCEPRAGWLSKLLPHFADPQVAVVAPRIVAIAESADSGWLGRYEAVRSPLDRGPEGALVVPGGRVPFVPAATLLVRASAMADGFDESLPGAEDVDFVWRMAGRGCQVRYEPAGEVGHEHRTTPAGFLSRRAHYGRTAAPLSRQHPGAARPLALSPWSAAAWAAVAARRPMLAAAITGVACGLLSRDLRGVVDQPVREAVRLAGGGTLHSGVVVADSLVRAWWPLSIVAAAVVPRLRPALAAAAIVPAVLEWRRTRPDLDPLRWTVARVLDDAAYGFGVWRGCIEQRTLNPLSPDLGWRLRIESADDLPD